MLLMKGDRSLRLGIYPQKTISQDTCTPVFIAALLIVETSPTIPRVKFYYNSYFLSFLAVLFF